MSDLNIHFPRLSIQERQGTAGHTHTFCQSTEYRTNRFPEIHTFTQGLADLPEKG